VVAASAWFSGLFSLVGLSDVMHQPWPCVFLLCAAS
jgi:hypothetical protein